MSALEEAGYHFVSGVLNAGRYLVFPRRDVASSSLLYAAANPLCRPRLMHQKSM